jgi:hypothetical protein
MFATIEDVCNSCSCSETFQLQSSQLSELLSARTKHVCLQDGLSELHSRHYTRTLQILSRLHVNGMGRIQIIVIRSRLSSASVRTILNTHMNRQP